MNDLELSELQASRNHRRRRYRINLSRHVYNEQEFTESFITHEEYATSIEFERPSFSNLVKRHFCRANCAVKDVLHSWFPIVEWLPRYNVRRDLAHDLAGGLTVAIMHLPQGKFSQGRQCCNKHAGNSDHSWGQAPGTNIPTLDAKVGNSMFQLKAENFSKGLAYAMLASLPAVTGLYTAFVPILVYMAMGTSRHLSLGTFAVVCLMVGHVVEKVVEHSDPPVSPAPTLVSVTPLSSENPSASWESIIFMEKSNSSFPSSNDLLNEKKLEVAVALSLLVGLVQFVMGLLKLGFVAVYLSDPIISGFTTGAAILVFTSQIKHLLGLKVPRFSGVFAVVKTYIHMFKHITMSVKEAFYTGGICILSLIGLKFISERLKHKLKFPIPAELIVVVLGTLLSYIIRLNEKFEVEILGDIPKGLRIPSPPSFLLMGNLITDAVVIAIVIFATNVSLAKTFAKRNNYVIDSNQELIACGSANIVGSFFSCFPVSGSLSRSVIQESIARTQLCTIPVVIVIILVLLFIAPLFYHLPKAILAAIVVVALKGLFQQFRRLIELWKICKPDAMVWFATWLGVVLLGIDIGLGVGVISALVVVLAKSSRPPVTLLGQIPRTGIYRDLQRVPAAKPIPGVRIFRFESALFYANAEYFRSALIELTGIDPQCPHKNSGSDFINCHSPEPSSPTIKIEGSLDGATFAVNNSCIENGIIGEIHSGLANPDNVVGDHSTPVHAVIVDASTFNFVDTQGVTTLMQLGSEFENIGVKFYLAHCRYYVRDLLEKAGFTAKIGSEHLFVSIHDAVVHAVGIHSEVESCVSPPLSDTESVAMTE